MRSSAPAGALLCSSRTVQSRAPAPQSRLRPGAGRARSGSICRQGAPRTSRGDLQRGEPTTTRPWPPKRLYPESLKLRYSAPDDPHRRLGPYRLHIQWDQHFASARLGPKPILDPYSCRSQQVPAEVRVQMPVVPAVAPNRAAHGVVRAKSSGQLRRVRPSSKAGPRTWPARHMRPLKGHVRGPTPFAPHASHGIGQHLMEGDPSISGIAPRPRATSASRRSVLHGSNTRPSQAMAKCPVPSPSLWIIAAIGASDASSPGASPPPSQRCDPEAS